VITFHTRDSRRDCSIGGAEGESPAADRCLVGISADVAIPLPLSKRNRRDVLDEVFSLDVDLWW
jgi:hypothetical protein